MAARLRHSPSTSVRRSNRYCSLIKLIDLSVVLGIEAPMDRTWIRRSLLEPKACSLSISKSPQVRMTVFASVGKEESDIQGLQSCVVECQRAFNISYSQDDVVDHILSFKVRGLR